MTKYTPLILLASERSGTNLLRAVLDNHSEISSPPPSGMVEVLPNIAYRCLLPWESADIEELIEHAITLTTTHMNPWDINLSVDRVKDELDDLSFWGVFRRINEIYAEQNGASYWFSKEPGLFSHPYAICTHIPDARFVYMVRDGRDVASSMLEHGLHEKHIYPAAQRWSSEQRLCLSVLSDPRMSKNVMMIRYEDLVASPESELTRLMQFIGLEVQPAQLTFHSAERTVMHANKSVFWKNLTKPINTSRKGRHLEKLSRRQLEVFESVAWMEMISTGYQLHSKERASLSRRNILGFRLNQFLREQFARPREDAEERRLRKLRQKEIQNIINRGSFS